MSLTDSVKDQVSYDKHRAMILDRLVKIEGDDVYEGAIVIFVNRKTEELSIHGVNLSSEEVKFILGASSSCWGLDD
jgi:hypothetical protein